MAFEGRLQQWNDERGFGFIEVEATRERVFVHASALPRDGMRPATGARLRFDVERDPQGRRRAVNVRLADARNALPRSTRARRRRDARVGPPRRRRASLLVSLVMAVVAVAAVVSGRLRPPGHALVSRPAPALARPAVDADPAQRRCDGRTHCTQMRSCEEATWFLKNCPGAEMDGNHDGVPCEQQWCGAHQALAGAAPVAPQRRPDNAPRRAFSREETMNEQRGVPPGCPAMAAARRRR